MINGQAIEQTQAAKRFHVLDIYGYRQLKVLRRVLHCDTGSTLTTMGTFAADVIPGPSVLRPGAGAWLIIGA